MKLAIACAMLPSVGARFIAPLVPVAGRFANRLRGAINLAPTGGQRASLLRLTPIPSVLLSVYLVNVHQRVPEAIYRLLSNGSRSMN